jgi:hypothetical protein
MPPTSQPEASPSRPGRAAQSRPLPEAVKPSSWPPLPVVVVPPPVPPVPGVLHMPIVSVVELHTSPDGQPLPNIMPRQPGSHIMVGPQTWPLIEPPQFASMVHCTHVPIVLSVEVQVSAGIVGQPLPPMPRQPGSHVDVVVLQTWPLFDPPQSESVEQPGAQAPVVVLQMGPVGSPVQSVSVMHLPQVPAAAPEVKQWGVALSAQGAVAEEPWSPSQGTQVDVVASQTGVDPMHAEAFEAVHWTQVFVVALQVGVVPEHWLSIRQATQTPMFGPVVAQRVDRHTVPPFAPVQGPSPSA